VSLAAPVVRCALEQAPSHCEGAFVLADANVLRRYPAFGEAGPVLAVRPGERSKSVRSLARVWEWLAAAGARRDSRVAALGGGVVGDLAGFAAATFMRGVPVVQVPTTLMAMVDSAHGGKSGVNLAAGKNLAGAFAAPERVVLAPAFLATLPAREFRAGAAEVWKYGTIALPALLERLESAPLSRRSPDLEDVVAACAACKLDIVGRDPYETTGERAALNFGHTVGHALEKLAGYGKLRHGEAVAIGMVAESRLAERLGHAVPGLARRLAVGLASQGLPTGLPDGTDAEALVAAMGGDKKRTGYGLAFSLVSEPGRCTLVTGVAPDTVVAALRSG
jgi:3-dehydroquinate synthase